MRSSTDDLLSVVICPPGHGRLLTVRGQFRLHLDVRVPDGVEPIKASPRADFYRPLEPLGGVSREYTEACGSD